MKRRFNWEPSPISDAILISEHAWSSAWHRCRYLRIDYSSRAARAQRLLLHWWARGLQNEAWDHGPPFFGGHLRENGGSCNGC